MRLAVIGLGRMGHFYAQTVAAMAPAVELAAVADQDAGARARVQTLFRDAAILSESNEVLERPDIDAVIVATPTSTHAEVIVAAAKAGKAIFSEKPLALTVEETRDVLAVVEQAGVTLQVGFMRRFDPAYRRAKEYIDAGRIGRPVTFKAVGRDPSCPPLDYANPSHSGGLIVDMGIHDFDLARWLMSSEVERVSADGSVLVCEELATVGDIDNAVINLHFANGALGNVEVSRNARYGYDVRTEVLGSEGSVRIGGGPGEGGDVALFTPQPKRSDDTPFFIRRFADAYRAEIEYFVQCLKQRRTPSVGGADALAAIQIAEAATRSARTGVPVTP